MAACCWNAARQLTSTRRGKKQCTGHGKDVLRWKGCRGSSAVLVSGWENRVSYVRCLVCIFFHLGGSLIEVFPWRNEALVCALDSLSFLKCADEPSFSVLPCSLSLEVPFLCRLICCIWKAILEFLAGNAMAFSAHLALSHVALSWEDVRPTAWEWLHCQQRAFLIRKISISSCVPLFLRSGCPAFITVIWSHRHSCSVD